MRLKRLSRSICLIVPILLVLASLAVLFDRAVAGSGTGSTSADGVALIKDGREDDDDDRKDHDHSGHGRHGDDDREDHGHSGRGRHGDDDHGDDDGRGDVPRPTIDPAELGDAVVEIVDEQFIPAEVTINPGQSITFINLDDDLHTATGIGFDTGPISPGGWKTVTLDVAGEAPYVCQFHSDMLGTVTVRGDADSAPPTPASAKTTAGEGDASAPDPEPVTISVEDFSFSTPNLEIPVGTTVTWVNNGQAPHTVTGPFGDSGLLQPGDTFSFTFDAAGSFDYVCQFHPQMTARIVVTSSAENDGATITRLRASLVPFD